VACTCVLTLARARGVAVVKSQVEVYCAKPKEYARLTILTKSLRESRRYRKPAEMYWALALREELECVQPSKMIVKTSPTSACVSGWSVSAPPSSIRSGPSY
jgi:hypothetical protein